MHTLPLLDFAFPYTFTAFDFQNLVTILNDAKRVSEKFMGGALSWIKQ